MSWTLLGGAAGWLAGSIPFGLILARFSGRGDPRRSGSGNIGATNVARTLGFRFGLLTLALDALKGALPAAVFATHHGPAAGAAAGLGAVVGHCFSPWLRLRGGKGVATLLGVAGALAWPWGFAAFAAVWVLVMALTRWASVASLVAAWLVPLVAWGTGRPTAVVVAFALIALVVTVQHRSNLSRLLRGTEPRFGRGKPEEPA